MNPHIRTQASALLQQFQDVRTHSENICAPLQAEDYVVQPVVDVSPPKWHLAHTTWFFETFILVPHLEGYEVFHPRYPFLFNSYYEHAGPRILRHTRGNLTRPSTEDIYAYRAHVDAHMKQLIEHGLGGNLPELIELGLHHEQQHQELLLTDIKYILGHNPLFPVYGQELVAPVATQSLSFIPMAAGLYEIGHQGEGFCFDNELGRHQVYLNDYAIADRLVTQGEYLEFMEAGGYQDFSIWLSEAWAWVNEHSIEAPLYWIKDEGTWYQYTLGGLVPIDPNKPVTHISYYEADAFARWKGLRLPTEFEWEAASGFLPHGTSWEWTQSAYLPYPGFQPAPGALGEYNGKFMVNQMVLRGGSVASSPGHVRPTYRNFFQTDKRWQFTGIRLVKDAFTHSKSED